jgi:hypothetical protein
MAKLKTFEEYIESLDRSEEIEDDTMAMGEPEEQGTGDEVITAEQPDAEEPAKSDDEGAGVDAEEMEADTEEVYSEDDKEIVDPADQELDDEDEGEEGSKEVTESEEEDDDEVESQIADIEDEEGEDEESNDHEAEESPEEEEAEKEEGDEESEEAEAQATVEEMVKELYERVKSEAKVWEEDMHDGHTIESYLKENAALMAMMAAKAMKESREEITQEQYEAGCNGLKESYSKKMDEMLEAWDAEGEEIED